MVPWLVLRLELYEKFAYHGHSNVDMGYGVGYGDAMGQGTKTCENCAYGGGHYYDGGGHAGKGFGSGFGGGNMKSSKWDDSSEGSGHIFDWMYAL